MAAATGLIDAAEATHNPSALFSACIYGCNICNQSITIVCSAMR